jgi:predicted nucleic acid-binding protein
MSDRFFLDSNILICSFDQTSPAKARRALALIQEAHRSCTGAISFHVIQEFFNFALRRSLTSITTIDATEYLRTVLQPLPIVHSSHGLYAEALHLQGRRRLSWYDSLIVAAALEADCSVLYSEDLQHGQRFGSTTVTNPFRTWPCSLFFAQQRRRFDTHGSARRNCRRHRSNQNHRGNRAGKNDRIVHRRLVHDAG